MGPFEFYLDAFRELSTCRPGAMDLMPIPFTAIVEYSRIYELGDFDDFFYIIRAMDDVFLKLYYDASKKSEGKNASNNSNKNNKNKS